MASASFRFLTLAILMIAGTLAFGDHGVSAQCETIIPRLVAQCSQYVQVSGPKAPPSQDCCNVINISIFHAFASLLRQTWRNL
ncbi:hypothetical protein CRYUN_Cryun02cG0144500 [Craigia yunnanensis]